jgi:hypothetical protein
MVCLADDAGVEFVHCLPGYLDMTEVDSRMFQSVQQCPANRNWFSISCMRF